MTVHAIWALVAAFWALVLWDMVRRWAFATATRALKADLDALRAETAAIGGRVDERGLEKLPARVKQLETVVLALKQHVETQVARPNPFGVRKAGG
jgi:hypothetical protein